MQLNLHECFNTNKCLLSAVYNHQKKMIQLLVLQNKNNTPPRIWSVKFSDPFIQEDPPKLFRSLLRYRNLHIQTKIKTIDIKRQREYQLKLQDVTFLSQYYKIKSVQINQTRNYGIQYWNKKKKNSQINCVLDPHLNQISLTILQRKKQQIRIAQSLISLNFLKKSDFYSKGSLKQQQLLSNCFKGITQSTFSIHWKQKNITNRSLLPSIPLQKVILLENSEKKQDFSRKFLVFKHIFLTEIIAFMIINQFGKSKWVQQKYRDGITTIEYNNQSFEKLRNSGYRFSEFKDYPFKSKTKKMIKKLKSTIQRNQQNQEQFDDDESDIEEYKKQASNINIQISKTIKKKEQEKKNTKLQKIFKKMEKKEDICNFTFISGKEKSQINKMRYCLNQMTRETDKTQALIDFLRLVFKIWPRQELVWNQREKIQKKQKMAFFLQQFKVRRKIQSCFQEYTRESFFHKVLNIGLRVLKNPYELVYLRLPFSHIFWSIKEIYQHHKKTIFQKKHQHNQDSKIILYRGFEINEKQIKMILKNIGGYLEIEGFLSTSLEESLASAFSVNAKMVIEIPLANLKGMFDNGFAHISNFSEHKSQREILVNAFNVFKIISLHSEFDEHKQMIVHIFRFEYGSIRAVEEKVKKSENLLDAEYQWRVKKQEFRKAVKVLQINKQQMTEKGYKQLFALLPKAQKQLEKRRKELKKWETEEYQSALEKLSEWEKELIVNSKHQQLTLGGINNYGELLYQLGQYRRAMVYFRRRMKQFDLTRAVEGHYWRTSQCLLFNYKSLSKKLCDCYAFIGRPAESLAGMEKLLNFYVSINVAEKDPIYYQLLYKMQKVCGDMYEKVEQRKKYKQKLMRILRKYDLTESVEYQSIMLEEKMQKLRKKKKQKEQEESENSSERNERKERIKSYKEKLKNIEKYTFGKYSATYLQTLTYIVEAMYEEEEWECMFEQCMNYLNIVRTSPQLQFRTETCGIFLYILLCPQQQSRYNLCRTCSYIPHFLHDCYNYKEMKVVHAGLKQCWKKSLWVTGKRIVMKLMKIKIKCKIQQTLLFDVMVISYGMLLCSGSSQECLKEFVNWVKLYQGKQKQDIIPCIIENNEAFWEGEKNVITARAKDYQDTSTLQFINDLVSNGTASLQKCKWEDRRVGLIPWQHPLYSHYVNIHYIDEGIYHCLERQQHDIRYYKQIKNSSYNLMDASNIFPYLQKVYTFTKLHLNSLHISLIPELLTFFPCHSWDLQRLLVGEIGVDFQKVMRNTQHLRQYEKDNIISFIHQAVSHNLKITIVDKNIQEDTQVRITKRIYARYKHYRLFTPNRHIKTTHKCAQKLINII